MGAEDIRMNFTVFITGLLAEGLMALGAMKNPLTQETKKDLKHASHVIDALGMLQEKTKGNLAEEEDETLTEAIHQLQMLYVAMSKEPESKGAPSEPEGEAQKGSTPCEPEGEAQKGPRAEGEGKTEGKSEG